jgi:hypothetical protein
MHAHCCGVPACMPGGQQRARAQVQDKALDILAHHIRGDVAACRMHLGLIQQASRHPAVSVRKRAVDILWECYINDDAFAAANRRTCVRLLLLQLQLYDGVPLQPCTAALTVMPRLRPTLHSGRHGLQSRRRVCTASCWTRSAAGGLRRSVQRRRRRPLWSCAACYGTWMRTAPHLRCRCPTHTPCAAC